MQLAGFSQVMGAFRTEGERSEVGKMSAGPCYQR